MEDERLSEKHVAPFGDAVLYRHGAGDAFSIRSGDLPARVRAKGELKAAVFSVGPVEMDSGEEHVLQEFDRRLCMLNAGFVGPVGEAWRFDALPQCDNAILMPGQRPVVSFGFVEGNDTHRPRAGKRLRCQSIHFFETPNEPIRCPGLLSTDDALSSATKHSSERAHLNQTRPSCSSSTLN